MIVEHCILLILNVELEQGAQPVPVPQAMDRVHPWHASAILKFAHTHTTMYMCTRTHPMTHACMCHHELIAALSL